MPSLDFYEPRRFDEGGGWGAELFATILVVGLITLVIGFISWAIWEEINHHHTCVQTKKVKVVEPVGHRYDTSYYVVFEDGTAADYDPYSLQGGFRGVIPVEGGDICVREERVKDAE